MLPLSIKWQTHVRAALTGDHTTFVIEAKLFKVLSTISKITKKHTLLDENKEGVHSR